MQKYAETTVIHGGFWQNQSTAWKKNEKESRVQALLKSCSVHIPCHISAKTLGQSPTTNRKKAYRNTRRIRKKYFEK